MIRSAGLMVAIDEISAPSLIGAICLFQEFRRGGSGGMEISLSSPSLSSGESHRDGLSSESPLSPWSLHHAIGFLVSFRHIVKKRGWRLGEWEA